MKHFKNEDYVSTFGAKKKPKPKKKKENGIVSTSIENWAMLSRLPMFERAGRFNFQLLSQ
jgi:hypothetical protein